MKTHESKQCSNCKYASDRNTNDKSIPLWCTMKLCYVQRDYTCEAHLVMKNKPLEKPCCLDEENKPLKQCCNCAMGRQYRQGWWIFCVYDERSRKPLWHDHVCPSFTMYGGE